MLDGMDDRCVPTNVRALRGLASTTVPARPVTAAEQALLDVLKSHQALVRQMNHDGTAGWTYRSVYELVAACGRWFVPVPLPAEVRALPERNCFANAATTEREHPHLAYTEGFALADGCPVPTAHAWCTDAEGHVIDPTWSDLGGSAFLGIRLPSNLRPRGPHHYGVLEAPESLYPLLRDGI